MILELCLALAPQDFDVDEWYRLQSRAGAVVVSAKRDDAPAERAIRELVRVMKWRVQVESDDLIEKLAPVSVDLAFTRRDPRVVAQWIAAAAGLDVTFHEDRGQVVLSVVDGRHGGSEGLRRRAIDWYERILDAGAGSITGTARLEALMGLGDVLEDAGELARAATVYDRVYEEDGEWRFAKRALLRASAVHLATAARAGIPEVTRRAHLQLAEETARRLLKMKPVQLLPAATLQLGRVLARSGRWRDCIQVLERADAPSDIDLSLLLAEAFVQEGRPDRSVDALDRLIGTPELPWDRASFRDYHYLRGTSVEALARETDGDEARRALLLDALRSLEFCLGLEDGGLEEDHPRRARAMTALGRVYLGLGRCIEAQAAARHVLASKSRLDAERLQAARILEAEASFAIGFEAAALDRLEMAARANAEELPGLVLFLVETLIDDGQYERAVANADLLARGAGPVADEARHRKVLALFGRAKRDNTVEDFAKQAAAVLASIHTPSSRSKTATVLALAHESLGQHEKAAALHPSVETLFRAGEYDEVLRQAGPIEENEEARLADVFRAGRCHEELHRRMRVESLAAAAAAAEAQRAASDAAERAAKIRAAKKHLRSEHGDFESVSRYEVLLALQESGKAQSEEKLREAEAKKRSAAGHFERAHDIYTRIERRDVSRSHLGEVVPGPWAIAAKRAREMMHWIDDHKAWTPPRIRWTSK